MWCVEPEEAGEVEVVGWILLAVDRESLASPDSVEPSGEDPENESGSSLAGSLV